MQGKPFFSREVTGVEVAVVGVDTVTGVEVEFSRLTLTVLTVEGSIVPLTKKLSFFYLEIFCPKKILIYRYIEWKRFFYLSSHLPSHNFFPRPWDRYTPILA